MNSLEDYRKLTIRVSKAKAFRRNRANNGHGYRYFVRCDEMPGCCGHGSTISDALENFQKVAKVWLSWFGNLLPQDRKV